MSPYLAAINAIGRESKGADTASLLIAAKCRALMAGYHARWGTTNLPPIVVEELLFSRLINPETGRKSRDLSIAGKLDLILLRDGRRVLVDHKTCSEDIEDPVATYWRQLVVESQPSHYMLLKWLLGEKLDEACWDVIRRPTISPRQFKSRAEKALAVSNRQWFGTKLSDETVRSLADADGENLEMYEARLTHDCTTVRPQWYFQRRTVPRLDEELLEYAAALWETGQLLLDSRKKNRWPKHPHSCMAYGRPCTYLGICSGYDSPEGPKWVKRGQVHSELTEEQDRNTLTYTSIRTLQACPRKFYYRYELGIERADEEESEALRFGHLFHTALEAYWEALLPTENHHVSSVTEPANSVGCGHAVETAVPF